MKTRDVYTQLQQTPEFCGVGAPVDPIYLAAWLREHPDANWAIIIRENYKQLLLWSEEHGGEWPEGLWSRLEAETSAA